MIGVKYLAECFSKKTQKSDLGCNYYQILMHKNQILFTLLSRKSETEAQARTLTFIL